MHLMRLVLLSVVITLLLNCSGQKNNFYVHNKDTQAIDSLHISVGDRTYLLEDIQSRKSKSLKIPQLGGHKISLQADTGKVMNLGIRVSPPFRGAIKAIITKERVISSGTYSN